MVFRALSGFGVGDGVTVRDAVGLAVWVGGGVGVRLAVYVGVFVRLGVTDAVCVAVEVGVGVAVDVAVSVAVPDGAGTTVWVTVADGARTVAEGVFIGDALRVLVGLLVAVRVVVRGLGIVRVAVRVLVRGLGIVRVAVRVFVRVFVLVSVAIRAYTADPPDACGTAGHCKQVTNINSSTVPVSHEEGVPIQPRFNPSYTLPTLSTLLGFHCLIVINLAGRFADESNVACELLDATIAHTGSMPGSLFS